MQRSKLFNAACAPSADRHRAAHSAARESGDRKIRGFWCW